MKTLLANIMHWPTTKWGVLLAIIAGLPQVPGFDKLVMLNSTVGTIITYVAGVAALIAITAFGGSK